LHCAAVRESQQDAECHSGVLSLPQCHRHAHTTMIHCRCIALCALGCRRFQTITVDMGLLRVSRGSVSLFSVHESISYITDQITDSCEGQRRARSRNRWQWGGEDVQQRRFRNCVRAAAADSAFLVTSRLDPPLVHLSKDSSAVLCLLCLVLCLHSVVQPLPLYFTTACESSCEAASTSPFVDDATMSHHHRPHTLQPRQEGVSAEVMPQNGQAQNGQVPGGPQQRQQLSDAHANWFIDLMSDNEMKA
jgi:hypothetical protein